MKRLLFTFLYLLITLASYSSVGPPVTAKLQGPLIIPTATFSTEDNQYLYMTSVGSPWATEFDNIRTKNLISLRYDESSRVFYTGAWGIEVQCDVQKFNELGAAITPSEQCTLNLTYDPVAGTKYVDNSTYQTEGGYRVVLTVVNVIFTGGIISTMPPDVILETSIETERYWFYDDTNPLMLILEKPTATHKLPAPAPIPNSPDNTMEFNWSFLVGAEEYDLEWMFVSFYDASTHSQIQNNLDQGKGTRVTLTDNYYNINLVYDKGYIVYRVRGVGRMGTDFNQRAEGLWSDVDLVSLISAPNLISNLDDERNWQYTASYAEEGKAKEVLSFFDGSLRNRQAITKLNTENRALITETIYDYEGRAAVQTLPAPDISADYKLKFYANYSLNLNSDLYSRKDFDNDALYGSCVLQTTPEMKNTQGASNYYSPSNGNTDGFNAAISDAQEYPFTQTQFGSDGRIRAQSGVGKNHTLSSGHQTNYFYATPSQEKLDRLFGNDAGHNLHYSEKMVQDANGQVSVSYEDLSGKVIATALAGEKPDNLDGLSSNIILNITEDFSNLNEYISAEEALYIENKIPVTVAGTQYDFTYTMTPEQFSELCVSPGLYDCKYDLTFNVWDDQCNQIISGVQVSVTDINGSINYPGFPTTVIMSNLNLTATFQIVFPRIGTYTIEKRISLNQEALDLAVSDFKSKLPGNNCIAAVPTYIYESEDCSTCDESCKILHDYDPDNDGIIDDYALYTLYLLCIGEDCGLFLTSACEPLLQNIITDMSPDGQYFDNHPVGSTAPPDNTWLTDHLWNDNDPQWTNAGFLDASGTPITTWDALRVNWNQFAEKVFTSACTTNVVNVPSGPITHIGNSLIEFHPEYCAYTWCTLIKSSKKFEVKLNLIERFDDAQNMPTGGNPYLDITPTLPPIGHSLMLQDPYFTSPGNTDQAAMVAFLTNNGNGSSMWVEAGNNTSNTDEQWLAFKSMYLSRKNERMNLRKEDAPYYCFSPCDNTTPPDNVADACNAAIHTSPTSTQLINMEYVDASTNGFQILDPDFNHLLNGVYTNNLSGPGNPPAGWDPTLNTNENCKFPASVIFDVDEITGLPGACNSITLFANASASTSFPSGLLNVPLTDGACCMNVTDVQTFVLSTVSAINNHISDPDFTAEVGSDLSKFIIHVPASIGVDGNTISIDITSCAPFISTSLAMTGGNNDAPCPEFQDCFCTELQQFQEEYEPNSSGIGSGVHVPASQSPDYTNFNTYIAYSLDQAYSPSTSVDPADVESWLGNCESNQNTDPAVPVLPCPTCVFTPSALEVPAEIDCDQGEPCDEDASVIAEYWQQYQYNQLVAAATQTFIAAYKAKCLTGPAFTESMNATHPDKEYHYTLYYYDQAGNLEHTVPPAGVQLLTTIETNQVKDYREGVPATTPIFPLSSGIHHRLITRYQYNTLDQVREQSTPDAGRTKFFYDKVGRIVASQNDKQFNGNNPPLFYSYTIYDGQGRIKEVGQVSGDPFNLLTQAIAEDPVQFSNYLASGVKEQVTQTFYDTDISLNGYQAQFLTGKQENLRQRVSSTTIEESFDGDILTYDHATHYSYDIHGNVNELVQENSKLAILGTGSGQQQFKKTSYAFDLVSGNVNEVHYQDGKADQFHHKYEYDADNRITNTMTSKDSVIWDNDAKYFYYLHGPLARTEIGERSVQGMDYAYTIQGWIKGVNSNRLAKTGEAHLLASINDPGIRANTDIGRDAINIDVGTGSYQSNLPNMHNQFAADGFGYTLGYYNDGVGGVVDYKPILPSALDLVTDISAQNGPGMDLFNGNIKQMSTALMQPNPSVLPSLMPLITNQYFYDQLNRITLSQSFLSLDPITPGNYNYTTSTSNGDYANFFTYDANGNLASQKRDGITSTQIPMDELTYFYYKNDFTVYAGTAPLNATNRLAHVTDAVVNSLYTDDLENQVVGNYTYDQIGNLESDAQEEIANIDWTVYGKVKSITRTTNTHNKPDLEFEYDASGNRIMKLVKPRTAGVINPQKDWTYTYYVRDAQGSVLAVYERYYLDLISTINDVFALKEQNVFGSSRLGIVQYDDFPLVNASFTISGYNGDGTFNNVTGFNPNDVSPPIGPLHARELGNKLYEMTNHLGNVLTVVSDRKIGVDLTPADGIVDYYLADVVSATDYYAFGSTMPGRNFNSTDYRFGAGGQEKVDEISGNGNHYTAEYWEYDPRTTLRWNLDPVTRPWESPYSVYGRNPIINIDPNGADWFKNNETGKSQWHEATGKQGEESSLKGLEGTWTNLGTEMLEFSGEKLTYSWQTSDKNGKLSVNSISYDAVSGKGEMDPNDYWKTKKSFDYSEENQKKGNVGPIPEGLYSIDKNEIQKRSDQPWYKQAANSFGMGSFPGGDQSWGNNRWWIKPDVGTETYGRGGFTLHGGDFWGSRGCIDLCKGLDGFTKNFMKNQNGTGKVYLQVDYAKDLKITIVPYGYMWKKY